MTRAVGARASRPPLAKPAAGMRAGHKGVHARLRRAVARSQADLHALADRLSRAEKNRAALDRGDLARGADAIRALLKFVPPGAAIAIDDE